jgi:multisubunit Na+/H+ antiporter MnhF subunit
VNGYSAAALTLMIGGLGPVIWLGVRGEAHERLVALQFAGPVVVFVLMLISAATAQSSMLIVPIVLALLSAAGLLVFTRLLAPQAGVDTEHGDPDASGR